MNILKLLDKKYEIGDKVVLTYIDKSKQEVMKRYGNDMNVGDICEVVHTDSKDRDYLQCDENDKTNCDVASKYDCLRLKKINSDNESFIWSCYCKFHKI